MQYNESFYIVQRHKKFLMRCSVDTSHQSRNDSHGVKEFSSAVPSSDRLSLFRSCEGRSFVTILDWTTFHNPYTSKTYISHIPVLAWASGCDVVATYDVIKPLSLPFLARLPPQTWVIHCFDRKHHQEDFSNLETDNSYCKPGRCCMQGDLIVQRQSHEQLAR